MPARHRKPNPTGLHLARAGALTTLATIPLGITGTAVATPSHSSRDGDRESSGDSSRYDDRYVPWAERDAGDSDFGQDAGNLDYHHFSDADYRHGDDGDDKFTDDRDAVPHHRAIGAFHHARTSHAGDDRPRRSLADAKWDQLAQCESTQNWDANTGNGYRGGLQFTDATWRAYGGREYAPTANKASRKEQIAVAKKVQRDQGWNAWPTCSRKLGYV
jgi:hypothetical protein